MKNTGKRRLYRQLVAASLILGGAFQLAAPVLAEGTAAGTSISNTATGTYDDGSGTTIDTTSNTVTITVAEVAGIDVSPSNTPAGAAPGSNINYEFKVTNTGNDPTKFVLPSAATIVSGPGTVQSVIVSTNSTFGDGDDQTITNPYTTPSIVAGGSVYVRVVVTVNSGATAGTPINIEYGNSANPDGTNQDFTNSTPFDAKTEDNADNANGETAGVPTNGVREDSATSTANVAAANSLLNGPSGQPAATGPDGTTNTDFTDKSTSVPANTSPGTTIDPGTVLYTNTIQNTGNASAAFTVQPTTLAGILDGTNGSLPNGTTVKITDPVGGGTATYTWNGTNFTTGGTAVVITIAAGATANYTVVVDLPANTQLSTDMTTPGDFGTVVGGFPVPLIAYINDATAGFQGTETNNYTINKTYTGFMAMYKEARILASNGTELQPYTTNQTLLAAKFVPGNLVEYRIRYKNIASAGTGATNSATLTANNFKVIEDGLTGTNNWAKDNALPTGIDTSSVSSSATATAGSVSFFNGAPAAVGTDKDGDGTATGEVTRYENIVGTLLPGSAEGNFIFRRKLN
ncbi:MAG TPA: hypothetical protein V6D15_24625 [Oculatellaceae cyanobacterium]|jgi:hypothetical protein